MTKRRAMLVVEAEHSTGRVVLAGYGETLAFTLADRKTVPGLKAVVMVDGGEKFRAVLT